MNKPILKRACAYIIDLMLILIISSLFAGIEALNPNEEKYEETYNQYKTIISNTSDVNSINNEEVINITYDMSKYGISIEIINLVVTVLYFVVFQYLNNGKTLGKTLMKIKVVSKDSKKIKFYQILLRSLIINSILSSFVLILILSFCSKSIYLLSSRYIQFIDMTLVFVSIIMILFRQDGRGLHDIIASTEVIYDIEVNNKVKEATIVSKKSSTKRERRVNNENSIRK